ncbi:MAG: ubiquitin-like small modifier protein 1 [Acidimicrobiales bacterium]|mgnify:FL=1|jgi:molybdopterin converting factor small subunit|nr:MoaD/ThiS family protein [Acidimicrobiales bacterium]HAZ17526.1 molybdopterin synthase sulfur carrier subunit [Acidimicrobiaceae bacterium]HIE68216.1 MoaD/ThiS family protein [Acidimicrobiia bacterium]HAZ35790.1 molybdopterin synthase sulfur carrier subunit [Acidimicrobiaceae bacterium]HBA94832.1 molybdopterin synthase sulfur carrier subunit [Acidimicrobiaceae bacterium]
MAVIIRIPTTLRPLTAGQPEVEVEAGTVGEAIAALDAAHPGFTSRILDESGALRRFVNVFVSDDDVRFLDGLDTAVPEGATIAIVPAVAGG